VRLLGFAALVVLAGVGLTAVGGSPRVPADLPRLEQVRAVLSGSTLPVEALVLVLVDAAWLMWLWIVASLVLANRLTGPIRRLTVAMGPRRRSHQDEMPYFTASLVPATLRGPREHRRVQNLPALGSSGAAGRAGRCDAWP